MNISSFYFYFCGVCGPFDFCTLGQARLSLHIHVCYGCYLVFILISTKNVLIFQTSKKKKKTPYFYTTKKKGLYFLLTNFFFYSNERLVYPFHACIVYVILFAI